MLVQLALKGLLAALIPLLIVWTARDSNKYRKLVWVTAFLTFDLIMFGAFTRLTDSGLGCPDWPGCYGYANPFQAIEHIRAAEALMPDGPVTVMKAWIEMIHRYFAMGVGVLIIAIMTIAWRNWFRTQRQDARYAPGFPTFLLFFVCVQGAFGAWTVTMKLQPVIVTIHLLLGMGLLAALVWLGARQNDYPPVVAARSLRPLAAAGLAVLFIQIGLGGWVSTNYAALACLDYPLCNGQFIPDMDFEHGFSLWRELGKTRGGEYLPFPALVAIHWVHRMFAIVVLAVLLALALHARRVAELRRLANLLMLAIGIQFLTGMATIFLKWPLALAVIHNGGAAVLVVLLTVLNYRARLAVPAEAQPGTTRLSPA
ncbi:MAG TPA: COX15/CtaA family protein [Noviherbaspirillum sp.]|nr:COX15/CtaA family protein [Noviherbaspirillum sp.]